MPTILFSIIGILAHFSALLTALLLILTLLFYVRLDLVIAWLIFILPVGTGFYIALFILAWIGQFYGHKLEEKKPSFFKDLQFLLIGPAWRMNTYLRKLLPKYKTRQKSQINAI